jgi:protein-glutamine gamma-glutamyltransferase
VSLLEVVRQANRPGPPEHSITFRVAATGAVVVAIAACWAQGELSPAVAGASIGLVIVGNAFSYRRRARPLRGLKPLLAVAVIIAFGWFFVTVSATARAGNLTSVEGPLAVLFTLIQVTHAFDVPSRRDLGFSLAGSATLMAVAAAQAVDTTFGIYVLVWAVLGFAGLMAMWSSMVGGAPTSVRRVVTAVGASGAVALLVLAALPAPRADSSLVLPSSIANDLPIAGAASLVGGGPHGNEPVHAGSPSGRTGIGGFLGFAGPLNTADRASLGTQLVFRVRADQPTYWIAETFDQWTGQSWVEAQPPANPPQWREVSTGSPFPIPSPVGQARRGTPDYQTFYLNEAGPNLVFHAANAEEVWFPARRLYVNPYGTVRSGTSMGPGSVYTVLSNVDRPSSSELSAAGGPGPAELRGLPTSVRAQSLQLPHPYRRAAALAAQVTANDTSVYAKVVALEHWMGTHTKYTTDIPPLKPGQDTVNQFLFGSRRGYCEQISTSLAVMLRSLGIPAREATGYVPGPYNPITDLYDVQANDAHAWVQVWFPGYGWQSFDPTAFVPLANPSPAEALGHDLASVGRRIPLVPVLAVVAVALAAAMVVRRRRHAPRSWGAAITRTLEEAARRVGLAVEAGESLVALGARLDASWPPGSGPPPPGGRALAELAERAAYGAVEPDEATRRTLLAAARRLRRDSRRLRRPPPGGRQPPQGGDHLKAPATISSTEEEPALPPSSPRPRVGAGTP